MLPTILIVLLALLFIGGASANGQRRCVRPWPGVRGGSAALVNARHMIVFIPLPGVAVSSYGPRFLRLSLCAARDPP
jgi:hypothetical protein